MREILAAKIVRGIDMLEALASILVMATILALGAILFVIVCAMIGWMIYTTQNGGDDD